MLLLFATTSTAQEISSDTIVSLDSVVIHGRIFGSKLQSTQQGKLLWQMDMLDNMPKILGNADPIHYTQLLPGVSSNNEYDAGLHILGGETCHNYISIDGAPVYGGAHLFGLFSTFIPGHFAQMALQKANSTGAAPNRLGASLDLQTVKQKPDSITGNLSVGLISSQGTIHIPITNKSHLAVSLRGSYLNLLYGAFLESDETNTKYSFYDTNVTFSHSFDSNNSIVFNAYLGNDVVDIQNKESDMGFNAKWGNKLFSGKWISTGNKIAMDNTLYYSETFMDGGINMAGQNVSTPSSFSETANKYSLAYKNLSGGVDIAFYAVKPQIPVFNSNYYTYASQNRSKLSTEYSAYIDYKQELSPSISLSEGIRATHFNNNTTKRGYSHLSPSFNAFFSINKEIDVSIGYSYRHQNIVQTGMTAGNLPFEFWLTSGMYGIKPQASHGLSFYSRYSSPNGMYSCVFESYLKLLERQIEYSGNILSFVNGEYDLKDMIFCGSGRNYGVNLIFSKNRGKLTGWISYAFSKAYRTYSHKTLCGTFPANHDRTHEVNGVLSCKLTKRWDIGATCIFATGTPYTPTLYYSIISSNLIPQYAEHNSKRLNSYKRIDLSLNYTMRSAKEQNINFSIYNALGSKNDLFYYVSWRRNYFYYNTLRFGIRIMPSISYSLKF